MTYLSPTRFTFIVNEAIRIEMDHTNLIEAYCISWASGIDDPFNSRWSYVIFSYHGRKVVHFMFENRDDAIMFKLLV